MAYNGLREFIQDLADKSQIRIVDRKTDPELEVSEIADRIVKESGPALLFKNTGTDFPLLINMFGSEERMSMALGRPDLEDAGRELDLLFASLKSDKKNGNRISTLSRIRRIALARPRKRKKRGRCQEIVLNSPDLDILPVMKCWPHDGGKFITLPVVHTMHPDSGETNAGMYRMQVFDKNTTGMHWHRHKTGASHFEAWKKTGRIMPVTVVLGGDPVYTYAATAPLPQGVDEYLLAGWLRKKGVRMVKCITNELWVPADADIVIEGYVDPEEEKVTEGPFGDHTGFYSLADNYPLFHVTCITHRKDAVYPSTIVGIPPMEDSFIGLATERLFLYPIKIGLQTEITDIHMPEPGVAHNLVLVSIKREYPGQGMKVINGLFGAGQMMFSKFIIVLDDDIDLKDYRQVAEKLFCRQLSSVNSIITTGPLDVLDHSSDSFCFGGKMGIDTTGQGDIGTETVKITPEDISVVMQDDSIKEIVKSVDDSLIGTGVPVVFVEIEKREGWKDLIIGETEKLPGCWFFAVDKTPQLLGEYLTAWQVLANTDPARDLFITGTSVFVDATAKSHISDRFPRKWPNVVLSNEDTIKIIDSAWSSMELGDFISSPSEKASCLAQPGESEVSSG